MQVTTCVNIAVSVIIASCLLLGIVAGVMRTRKRRQAHHVRSHPPPPPHVLLPRRQLLNAALALTQTVLAYSGGCGRAADRYPLFMVWLWLRLD